MLGGVQVKLEADAQHSINIAAPSLPLVTSAGHSFPALQLPDYFSEPSVFGMLGKQSCIPELPYLDNIQQSSFVGFLLLQL